MGVDEATPVTEAYQDGGRFKGTIGKVTIDLIGESKATTSAADGEELRVDAVRRELSE